MESNTKVALIKQAILNELEGYEFYTMYSEKVTSPEVKKTFHDIAQEELKHVEYIRTLLKGNDSEILALSEIEVPSPGIFKFSNLTPDDMSLALAAFSIAMKMEDDSQKFYQDAADGTENQAEKDFFLKLRDWEIIHRDSFEAEYQRLREIWWSDNEFAPF